MGCQGCNPNVGGSLTPPPTRTLNLRTPTIILYPPLASSLQPPPRLLMRLITHCCLPLALDFPCPRSHIMTLTTPHQLKHVVLGTRFGKMAKHRSLMAHTTHISTNHHNTLHLWTLPLGNYFIYVSFGLHYRWFIVSYLSFSFSASRLLHNSFPFSPLYSAL